MYSKQGQKTTALTPELQIIEKLIVAEKLDEAEQKCLELETKQPNDPILAHALGLIYYMRQKYDQAIAKFKITVEQITNNPNFYNNFAEALRRKGRLKEALEHFHNALLVQPGFLKAHLGIANTLIDLKRYPEARARFEFIIQLNPSFAPAYHYLGVMLTTLEANKDAIPILRKAVSLKKDYYEAKFSLANALEQDSQTKEALDIYYELLKEKPQDAAVHNNCSNILRTLGRLEEAEEHIRQALKHNPEHLSAYYNRSAKSFAEEVTPEQLERLQALILDPSISEEDRSNLHFTLARYYDAQKDYKTAFYHYKQGNDIDNRKDPYDGETQAKVFSIFKSFFTKEFFATHPHFGSSSEIPVFIFGMPRSGTTLVEQVISSHPNVFGAGELKFLSQIVQSLAGQFSNQAGYPACLNLLNPLNSCSIGETYVNKVKELVPGDRSNILRITDKMPGNFTNLGVIPLLLPHAKLIHCRRDPMDSCFSNFTQHFTQVIVYTRKLEDLGHYYQIYEDLMAHWHNVLPMPILDVQYEDMVDNFEEMSRKIIDFVGLEWNDACLNFHETERKVKTASLEQVRKPIYKSSVGKWRRYEEFLGPLKDALGKYAPLPTSLF
jgi:tetratricopeptide (TPR) repeat protein